MTGKEVTELWLAQRLRPYGIRPKSVWLEGRSAKGYVKEDFAEAFRRYIPKSEVEAMRAEEVAVEKVEERPVVEGKGEGADALGEPETPGREQARDKEGPAKTNEAAQENPADTETLTAAAIAPTRVPEHLSKSSVAL